MSDAVDNLLPPTVTGNETVTVVENRTAVARYRARDPEGLTSTFTWSLGGPDAGAFHISAAGVLSFDTPPNYEARADRNGDNTYQVTVQASDGRQTGVLDVLVNVEDVDEPPVISGSRE